MKNDRLCYHVKQMTEGFSPPNLVAPVHVNIALVVQGGFCYMQDQSPTEFVSYLHAYLIYKTRLVAWSRFYLNTEALCLTILARGIFCSRSQRPHE
jgi:hypothetical protein